MIKYNLNELAETLHKYIVDMRRIYSTSDGHPYKEWFQSEYYIVHVKCYNGKKYTGKCNALFFVDYDDLFMWDDDWYSGDDMFEPLYVLSLDNLVDSTINNKRVIVNSIREIEKR